ncbi:MAG: hypothetical protein ACYTX0_48655, partial [Nostoc sp.]
MAIPSLREASPMHLNLSVEVVIFIFPTPLNFTASTLDKTMILSNETALLQGKGLFLLGLGLNTEALY